LEYGKTIDPAELIPASNQEAARLVATDPYAFLMAACLDRGTKAEIIWGIPFEIKKLLGHLDPNRIAKLSLSDLSEVFYKLPFKPRFINAAPRTIRELTTIVVKLERDVIPCPSFCAPPFFNSLILNKIQKRDVIPCPHFN